MKRLLIGGLCLLALASCNVKNSKEYKQVQAQRDSLAAVVSHQNVQDKEMMDLVAQVEDNFSQIREKQAYLNMESKQKGELSAQAKDRIKSDFEMIQSILKKNKQSLNYLSKKLKDSKGQSVALQQTIDLLNTQLVEKADQINQLQKILVQKDNQIKNLQTNVDSLSSNNEHLTSKVEEQDMALNTAYYMFGTSSELKAAKVITKGFLSSPKVLKESIDAKKFIQVDIRKTQSISLFAKKATIITDHPKDSYVLDKDKSGKLTLRITDYTKFWSLTKYLIIEVK